MVRKLSPRHKEARRIVRGWAKQLRPFADAHPDKTRFGEFRDSLRMDPNGINVQVENHADFHMRSYCGLPDYSEFAYSREVAPFEKIENRGKVVSDSTKNSELAHDLLKSLRPCYDVEGFESFVGGYAYASRASSSPSITFVGKQAGPELFGVYLDLAKMTDRFLDGHMKNIEQQRERPFKYVVVRPSLFAQDFSYERHLTFRKLETQEDIKDAKFVFASSRPVIGDVDGTMLHGLQKEGARKRYAEELNGEFMSVDEFLNEGGLD